MSRNRQIPATESEDSLVVRSMALTLPPGFRIEPHTHPWAQLVYATSGVLSVQTPAGCFVVPSRRAVWVPPGAAHESEMTGAVSLRTLYFHPDVASSIPDQFAVFDVSPLLRELVLEIVRRGALRRADPAGQRLAEVAIDQIRTTPEVPLVLPMPSDPRARRMAARLREAPGPDHSLDELARGVGASVRTLERLFVRDVGMSLGRWRQQARLLEALRRLATGASVTRVATEIGYESTSAFIAMFKRTLGITPKRYYEDVNPHP